ncbi:MAG: HPr kinase/phosphatase C-terminal domain-containing protein [Bradyrhizobium sp.]|nr:HPr kinase/phosphatase C-terminal domain-containing protein [Bradyrhizobium sp.]
MTGVEAATSVHASAVLVGDRAVLIRGPSGAGKSRLAFDLILAGRAGQIAASVLVGDDRLHLEQNDGQLLARPARELAGLIEIRGLGIFNCDFTPQAIVGLVVDLSAADAERLPPPEALKTLILGIEVPRIPAGIGVSSLPLVIAALTMTAISSSSHPPADCPKGIGNHISPTLATEKTGAGSHPYR